MAYTKEIGRGISEEQSSPAYVLTFTRWANRDVENYKNEDRISVRRPLVVVNDAVKVSVQVSKNNSSPVFSCELKNGDLNYLTAIHPGDFVMVNMVNWETKAMEIRARALQTKPINKYGDGFKGFFKVIDVRMELFVEPGGKKSYTTKITGKAFDEFNTLLYYNPAIVDANKKASPVFFLSRFDENWKDLLQKKEQSNVQNLVKSIIKTTVGTGTKKAVKGSIPQNEVPRYLMPPQVGKLLGIEKASGTLYASDVNNYYLGIWPSVLNSSNNSAKPPEEGFSGFFESDNDGNFFKTKKELPGSRQLAVQDFQNVQVWSLLKNYSNPVLNETYSCFRVAKNGSVYPSIIIRQKPFNTRKFNGTPKHTQYLDLPRWKINPNIITALSIGRSDSARINFVQVFTRSLSVDNNFNQSLQIQQGNFVAIEDDIVRSGMKPYIASCNFDYPTGVEKTKAKEWAELVADWLTNGHLKLNGSIQCKGIEDPICVGDNLEFDNIVYHIESVNHTMSISSEGIKNFRTNITLSMGISDSYTKKVPVYGEMDHTDALTKRQEDYDNERVLPGFSDTQDLPSRSKGEEVQETKQKSFTNPKSSSKGKKKPKKTLENSGIPYRSSNDD